MTKIKILPESLASKIAAGEVVQRPESVVKELLENSIDAKANKIELIIKKAGKSLIQVIDDGEGMSEEDAILCIHKHATSKIAKIEDLDNIRTLGFRGEALSAITAVSQFEIKTEIMKDELGTKIKINDENELIKEKGSFHKGTSISIKNIFYNIPARRNFLKSDATEIKHITDTFNRIALSNYKISFNFFVDDDLIYEYFPSDKIEDRISQIFGSDFTNSLIPFEEITEYISVKGFLGKPNLLKKRSGEQFLFLNKRFVISKQINHAVFTAYENFLQKGDYPFFIIFLDLDPKKVDINVHPSKLEVRFDNEKDIYNFVLAVVRKCIGSYDLVQNAVFSDSNLRQEINFEKMTLASSQKNFKNDFSDRPIFSKYDNEKSNFTEKDIELIFGNLESIADLTNSKTITHLPFDESIRISTQPKIQIKSLPDEDDSTFIIQLHNKYILTQIKSGLMIIDQHVAHERILYENALKLFEANFPFSQQLLFSKTIEVDPGTYQLIKEKNSYLIKLGFELKFFSKNTIVIEGVPQDIKAGTEEKILLEIMDEFINNIKNRNITDERDNFAKSFACKSAIKSGDKLSEKEMRVLIDKLFATSMPYVCPHGRPIVIKISIEEFDRRFGRT